MSDIKHYSHDNLPGGLKRDTFVADGNVLAPKLEALDEHLHELCDGPIEAMEEHVQRFVAALLRISIQEFCETWTKELERRLTAVQELHSGAMQAAKEGLV